MIEVLLNGEVIDVETGFSFVQRLDEELDEGQMVLRFSSRKEIYNPFTVIQVKFGEKLVASFFVSNCDTVIESYDPPLYSHELTLIEHAVYLEKFFVEGKTFTQPIDEKSPYPPYTLLDVVVALRDTTPLRLREEYEDAGLKSRKQIFHITQETKNKLKDVESPEFNFKEQTLRDCLDEVASELDGNVFLDHKGGLRINDFNELKKEITSVEYYDRSSKKDISQYSTNLSANVLNAVLSKEERDENLIDSWFVSTRTEDLQWDYGQNFIPTQKRIYSIDSIKVPASLRLEVYSMIQGDVVETLEEETESKFITIKDEVVEEKLAQTLEYATNQADIIIGDQLYANGVFVYEYGRKGINLPVYERLFSETESVLPIIQKSFGKTEEEEVLKWIEEYAPEYYPEEGENYSISFSPGNREIHYQNEELITLTRRINIKLNSPTTTDIMQNNLSFKAKYLAIHETARITLEKDNVEDNAVKTYMQGNQSTRIVDLPRFLKKNKSRVDRVGANDLNLSTRITDSDDMLELGDFLLEDGNKYIVTQREVIVYQDFLAVNYQLNKNFNKFSEFVGLNSEERQWEIGEDGRTIERNMEYDEYICIESGIQPSRNESLTLDEASRIKFLRTFDHTFEDNEPYNHAVLNSEEEIKFDEEDGPFTTNRFMLPLQKTAGANVVQFSTSLEGNASLGDYIESNLIFFGLGGEELLNTPAVFTDFAGRAENLKFEFASIPQYYFEDVSDYERLGKFHPIMTTEAENLWGQKTATITADTKCFKDNREVISFALNYHIFPEGENVIIGNALSKKNLLVKEGGNQGWKIRYYDEDVFFGGRDKERINKEHILEEDFEATIDEANQRIEITSQNIGEYPQYAIVDEGGRTVLIDRDGSETLTVHFDNMRKGVTFNPFEVVYENISVALVEVSYTSAVVSIYNPFDYQIWVEEITTGETRLLNAEESITTTFTDLSADTMYEFKFQVTTPEEPVLPKVPLYFKTLFADPIEEEGDITIDGIEFEAHTYFTEMLDGEITIDGIGFEAHTVFGEILDGEITIDGIEFEADTDFPELVFEIYQEDQFPGGARTNTVIVPEDYEVWVELSGADIDTNFEVHINGVGQGSNVSTHSLSAGDEFQIYFSNSERTDSFTVRVWDNVENEIITETSIVIDEPIIE